LAPSPCGEARAVTADRSAPTAATRAGDPTGPGTQLHVLNLPSPPPVLPVNPPVHQLGPGEELVRFYNPKNGPWDRQRSLGPLPGLRFDHQVASPGASSGRSVWYAATSLIGAVAEAFGNAGMIDEAANRRLCKVRLRSQLSLINLVGLAARSLGLDQRIGTTTDYALCQAWARALYERYPESQGIRWRGRQAGSICVLLNDRADMSVLELVKDFPIGHGDIWPSIARAARRARLRISMPLI